MSREGTGRLTPASVKSVSSRSVPQAAAAVQETAGRWRGWPNIMGGPPQQGA
ncbi:hypothetical protein ACFQZC_04125 [Streptacidiphilus monticola]